MKALEIFVSANRFMTHNFKLVVMRILVLVLSQITLACLSFMAAPARYDNTSSIGYLMLADYKDYFQPITLFYIGVGLSVIVSLIMIVLHFYTQAVLRDRPASLRHEAMRVGHAIVKAPWALALILLGVASSTIGMFLPVLSRQMMIGYIVAVALYICFIFIPLYYFAQMLYDNYSSLASVYQTSLEYVRKSWFVVLKLILLCICVYLVAITITQLSIRYISMPSYAVPGIYAFVACYNQTLILIGINIIYKKIAHK